MMERVAEELIGILDREVALYGKANDVAAREQEILVNVRIDELSAIIDEQEGLLVRLKDLERQRLRKVIELARALSMNLRGVTIRVLAGAVMADRPALGERLLNSGRELRAVIDAFSVLSEDNNRLIRNSMSFLDNTMREAFKAGGGPAVYSQKGRFSNGEEQKKNVIFVNRKV